MEDNFIIILDSSPIAINNRVWFGLVLPHLLILIIFILNG